jgi:hypothetical protein
MLKRSLMIAALIGTLLLAINQGDVVLRAEWPRALAWKVPLTYLVPVLPPSVNAQQPDMNASWFTSFRSPPRAASAPNKSIPAESKKSFICFRLVRLSLQVL